MFSINSMASFLGSRSGAQRDFGAGPPSYQGACFEGKVINLQSMFMWSRVWVEGLGFWGLEWSGIMAPQPFE